jgi:hypothetical protein
VFAGVFLLVQLGGFAHLALVRHATCAEHGELLHTDEVASDQAAAVLAERQAVSRGSTPLPDGDTHDHCLLATAPPACAAVADDQPAATSLPPVEVSVGFAPEAGSPLERARYRLAPKNSPPA